MGKIIRKNVTSNSGSIPAFDVSKIRSMSEKEATERAKSDLDAPIIDGNFIRKNKLRARKLKQN